MQIVVKIKLMTIQLFVDGKDNFICVKLLIIINLLKLNSKQYIIENNFKLKVKIVEGSNLNKLFKN